MLQPTQWTQLLYTVPDRFYAVIEGLHSWWRKRLPIKHTNATLNVENNSKYTAVFTIQQICIRQ
jgi:hypothetical protein